MLWLLAALAVAPLGGCVNLLSPADEVRIGQQAAPQLIEQAGGEVPDPQLRQYVSDIGHRLVEQIRPEHRHERPWSFHVLNTSILNAFALPDGTVCITRGLMEKLTNEAQLAGVLGHEVGHVVARHVGKQLSQRMAIELGLSAAVGVTESQWVELLGGVGGNLISLSYGRDQELEADGIGMIYMTRLGYDPQGMIGVLRVLEQASAGGRTVEFLSTHPHPENRLNQAQRLIASDYAHTQNNPQYKLAPEPYQQRALQPLSQLPPLEEPG